MAESAANSYPWESDYDEKSNGVVSENEVLLNTLTEHTTAILKDVNLSDKMWRLLLQRGVVDENTRTRIQGLKKRQVQAVSLVQHVMSVEVYKFHGFIWALVNSNQCHLAQVLGFAVRDYLDVDVYLMSSSFQCPACYEMYTKAYILTGCGHYVCAPCVKGAQFTCKEDKKEDVTCPLHECGKITEASPSDGKFGLEEDGHFSDLCEAMLNVVKNQSVKSTEGKSTTASKEEEGKSTTGNEDEERRSAAEKEGTERMFSTGSVEEEEIATKWSEEVKNLKQILKGGIDDLEVMISCLQKYRDILGKCEPGVKSHVVRAVEKVKQDVDDWAKERLGWYSSICQQVEKNLQKAVKWKNAASELSVLVTASPAFLEGRLAGKVRIPKETVTDAGEKLITKLDSGCSIPPLFPYKPCVSMPPTKDEASQVESDLGNSDDGTRATYPVYKKRKRDLSPEVPSFEISKTTDHCKGHTKPTKTEHNTLQTSSHDKQHRREQHQHCSSNPHTQRGPGIREHSTTRFSQQQQHVQNQGRGKLPQGWQGQGKSKNCRSHSDITPRDNKEHKPSWSSKELKQKWEELRFQLEYRKALKAKRH